MSSPLLALNRYLNKDAVKVFKVIQRIMGDRERDRPVGVRVHPENHVSMVTPLSNGSTTSLAGNAVGLLEEERWLLGEGLTHGELRDEIYCQAMKQLSGNPNPYVLLYTLLHTFLSLILCLNHQRKYLQRLATVMRSSHYISTLKKFRNILAILHAATHYAARRQG